MVHRCRAALRSRRGETLVEVLTAFALLLLFLSGFAASLHTPQRCSSARRIPAPRPMPASRRCARRPARRPLCRTAAPRMCSGARTGRRLSRSRMSGARRSLPRKKRRGTGAIPSTASPSPHSEPPARFAAPRRRNAGRTARLPALLGALCALAAALVHPVCRAVCAHPGRFPRADDRRYHCGRTARRSFAGPGYAAPGRRRADSRGSRAGVRPGGRPGRAQRRRAGVRHPGRLFPAAGRGAVPQTAAAAGAAACPNRRPVRCTGAIMRRSPNRGRGTAMFTTAPAAMWPMATPTLLPVGFIWAMRWRCALRCRARPPRGGRNLRDRAGGGSLCQPGGQRTAAVHPPHRAGYPQPPAAAHRTGRRAGARYRRITAEVLYKLYKTCK